MEIGNPSAYYENLKRYWRRRRYQSLNGENYSNKRKLKITRLGGSARRRQYWRIRSTPKLRLSFIVSPIKILAKFHDSYVNMMLRLAGNVGKSNSVDLFGGKRVPKGRQISMVSGGGEVDGRLVMEIYKRIASTREIAAF
ncbi:uncharacterized protein LOC122310401 [Carya illinoinensis]|uniref:Uncharacterized protein n=1 Tax=Carya illinoinensis TaxID=32201 RepID=A0A8T1QLY4_CARIL|nr:uncharacterized protein LOC122310401 [Carya illinoinensis]KAG6655818.1 hypothetical protein CIPAW_05G243300 [Carya illinoinensis]